MYVIQKGIPIGKENTRLGRYPFGEMEIGDSFVENDVTRDNALKCAAGDYGRRHGMKFRTRKFRRDNGSLAIRIWRIS